MLIHHIVLPDVWKQFENEQFYAAESLTTEGFIHCSFKEQLDTVLKRYYSGAGNVLILTIDSEKLSSRYVEEESTNREIYPHIYGPINRGAIVAVDQRATGC